MGVFLHSGEVTEGLVEEILETAEVLGGVVGADTSMSDDSTHQSNEDDSEEEMDSDDEDITDDDDVLDEDGYNSAGEEVRRGVWLGGW